MSNISQSLFEIIHPGILSTIQDLGRYGQSHLGLTSGGPADKYAYLCANRLLNNDKNCPVLEVSFGGLKLLAKAEATISITGANAVLTINGCIKESWQSHHINPGDKLEVAYASKGCRVYLAVAGGFIVEPQFSSVSTVIREKVGGLNGGPLMVGEVLLFKTSPKQSLFAISKNDIPQYSSSVTLKVVTGYQYSFFERTELAKFFSSEYQISSQSNRMGYRLNGPSIASGISQLYSEGISKGAIQIPPDGQPIVLANDRQTIGGYPKLGSVLSLDLDLLMQCSQGDKVNFEPISIHEAHTLLHLANAKYIHSNLIKVAS